MVSSWTEGMYTESLYIYIYAEIISMNCLFAGSFVLELATEIAVAIKMIDGTFTNCKQF